MGFDNVCSGRSRPEENAMQAVDFGGVGGTAATCRVCSVIACGDLAVGDRSRARYRESEERSGGRSRLDFSIVLALPGTHVSSINYLFWAAKFR